MVNSYSRYGTICDIKTNTEKSAR